MSTPRRQVARFLKPREPSSVRIDAVLTMQRTAAPWNRRSARYDTLTGMGNRARRYCGNCV